MKEELRRLQDEVQDLKQQQQQIQQRLEVVGKWLTYLEENRASAQAPGPEAAKPAFVQPAATEPVLATTEAARDAGAKSRDLEAKIGGIWLNRIGVLIFILGTAYFLGYAFDQGWINELTRIIIGVAAATALFIFGEFSRRRGYTGYGQGLSGGGVALLYFTVFAAFYFYDILSSTVGMGFLVLITIGAVLLAIYRDAPAVAVLGLLTGFLNPLLFAVREPLLLPLLSYLFLLNVGILALSYFKRWSFAGIIAFILTHLFLIGFAINRYQGAGMLDLSAGGYQIFLTLYLLLFCALPLALYIAHSRPLPPAGVFMMVSGAVGYFGLSWFNLEPLFPEHMGWLTLPLAAYYLLLGFGVQRLADRGREFSFTAYALFAALLVLFVPLQLKLGWITAGWTLQGCVLCYLGFRLADLRIRLGALAVLALALLRLIIAEWAPHTAPQDYIFLWNRSAALTLLFIAALALCAWFYHRNAPHLKTYPTRAIRLLGGAAGLLILIYVSIEIVRYGEALAVLSEQRSYYHNMRMLFLSLFWAAYAVALAAAGFIVKIPLLRFSAFGLFGLTVLKVFLLDLSSLELIYRIVSLVAVGLILLAVSYLYQRYRTRIDSST